MEKDSRATTSPWNTSMSNRLRKGFPELPSRGRLPNPPQEDGDKGHNKASRAPNNIDAAEHRASLGRSPQMNIYLRPVEAIHSADGHHRLKRRVQGGVGLGHRIFECRRARSLWDGCMAKRASNTVSMGASRFELAR